MKKIFITCTLILFFNTNFSQGLILNDQLKNHHKTYDRVSVSRSAVLPNRVSLEKYLPYIQNQGSSDMCVAYSIATCRTIIYARNNNLTDINKISAESYSPYYIYHRAKTSYGHSWWDGGLMMYMDRINQFGFAKMKDIEYPYYYPFTNQSLWNFSVPKDINLDFDRIKKDKFNSIKSILPRNNSKDSIADMINQIKTEISQEKPIIFAMDVPKSWLYNRLNGEDYWDPSIEYDCDTNRLGVRICWNKTNDPSGLCLSHKPKYWESNSGHAMVLIAYDDEKYGGSFQIVNSWGEDFGVNGKIWIQYEDFIKYADIIQSLDAGYKKTIFDVDNSSDFFVDKRFKQPDRLITKDFMNYTNIKWMMCVPILGMDAGDFDGEIVNGLKSGKGTFILENGFVYEGDWKDNKMNGHGKYSFKNSEYIGEFSNGYPHGKGYLKKLNEWGDIIEEKEGDFQNGSFFKGNIKIDYNLWDVFDVSGYPFGYRYEGEWSNGDFNGYGISYSYRTKKEYEGEWKDGLYHGKGKLTRATYKYEGDWYRHREHGFGVFTSLDQDYKYSGKWSDGIPNGKGEEITNKYKYVGDFKRWDFHGLGTKTYENGKVEEGMWYEGKFLKTRPILRVKLFVKNIF